MTQLLAVDAVDVTKTFGSVRAVDNISVRVAAGEVSRGWACSTAWPASSRAPASTPT